MKTNKINAIKENSNQAFFLNQKTEFKKFGFTDKEIKHIKRIIELEKNITTFHYGDFEKIVVIHKEESKTYKDKEKARKEGNTLCTYLHSNKIKEIQVQNDNDSSILLAFIEGLMLTNYQFDKYLKDKKKIKTLVDKIDIFDKNIKASDLKTLAIKIEGVFLARDLVNEPFSGLNSVQLAERIKELGKTAGFKTEVLEKKQIESLNMGGLLAVNKASRIPPTFSILEWKPENAKNKKPLILVGKGIVFDTGGYNLKPGQYMNDMKSDMAGAAAVIGTIYTISKLKLPFYVIGLVPSTDNLIGKDGYVTGDVITMHNGMTVEILNTDAEGRLILADALSYAKKYNPEFVIDMATLTGAAVRAIGTYASALMSTADKKYRKALIKSGKSTYERLIEFPMWSEYGEELKSEIADTTNLGSVNAGQITAAKFLELFTDYQWAHLDIASTAYMEKAQSYWPKGGTGIPVRLLIDFIENNFVK